MSRQVSIEEGDAKAREFNVMFIETSAKAGFNIKVIAENISQDALGTEFGSLHEVLSVKWNSCSPLMKWHCNFPAGTVQEDCSCTPRDGIPVGGKAGRPCGCEPVSYSK